MSLAGVWAWRVREGAPPQSGRDLGSAGSAVDVCVYVWYGMVLARVCAECVGVCCGVVCVGVCRGPRAVVGGAGTPNVCVLWGMDG